MEDTSFCTGLESLIMTALASRGIKAVRSLHSNYPLQVNFKRYQLLSLPIILPDVLYRLLIAQRRLAILIPIFGHGHSTLISKNCSRMGVRLMPLVTGYAISPTRLSAPS